MIPVREIWKQSKGIILNEHILSIGKRRHHIDCNKDASIDDFRKITLMSAYCCLFVLVVFLRSQLYYDIFEKLTLRICIEY
jgi:hypothetical protein